MRNIWRDNCSGLYTYLFSRLSFLEWEIQIHLAAFLWGNLATPPASKDAMSPSINILYCTRRGGGV